MNLSALKDFRRNFYGGLQRRDFDLDDYAPMVQDVTYNCMSRMFSLGMKIAPAETAVMLKSFYVYVDTELEDEVQETERIVDDAFVAGAKAALETVAEAFGVELENLDED